MIVSLDNDTTMLSFLLDPATQQPRMEKWLLRKAFDTPEQPYLPNDVLWRQKEQFSDGVGYSWIDSLREMVRR
jgi:asparagine synthase (glutamine-hydrolysing)